MVTTMSRTGTVAPRPLPPPQPPLSFTDIMQIVSQNPQKPKSSQWLAKQILVMYRALLPEVDHATGKVGEWWCLQDAFVDYMKQQFGTRKIVAEQVGLVLATTQQEKSRGDERAVLFWAFLFEELSKDAFNAYLVLSRAIDETLVMFEAKFRKPDDGREPIFVPLIAVVMALSSVLSHEKLLQKLARTLFENSFALDGELLMRAGAIPEKTLHELRSRYKLEVDPLLGRVISRARAGMEVAFVIDQQAKLATQKSPRRSPAAQ